jgi:uncharacterized protein
MNATTAFALLVKTPGHSPVKTRLAGAIGESHAETFHRLSAHSMAATLAATARRFPERILPLWAVAETDPVATAQWTGFPVVAQGAGDFAARLGFLYGSLKQHHPAVVLAATDSPEATAGVWLGAWRALQRPGSVIGPAADGGFYLVGSNLSLPDSVWETVPYSSDRAAATLATELERHGPVRWLPLLDDIDHGHDLARLSVRLEAKAALPEELARLALWARQRREETDAARLPG